MSDDRWISSHQFLFDCIEQQELMVLYPVQIVHHPMKVFARTCYHLWMHLDRLGLWMSNEEYKLQRFEYVRDRSRGELHRLIFVHHIYLTKVWQPNEKIFRRDYFEKNFTSKCSFSMANCIAVRPNWFVTSIFVIWPVSSICWTVR